MVDHQSFLVPTLHVGMSIRSMDVDSLDIYSGRKARRTRSRSK